MKRFHIALAVSDLDASVADYSHRLGQRPSILVAHRHAAWQTEALHLSIDQAPEHAGQLRQLTVEDEPLQPYPISLRD